MAGTFRSGRKPKARGLRVLQGSKVRPHHRTEPVYAAGSPEPAPHVLADGLALAKYRELVGRLEASRVLTTAHGEALAVLAETWADYVRCREQFAAAGYTLLVVDERREADGTVHRRVKDNPLIRRSERLALLLQRYLAEFGLTPVTGPRVKVTEPADVDPFEVFLGGKA